MSKRFLAFIVIICLLAPTITIHADVVMGNDFLDEIESKVTKLDRSRFVVNGPDGFVIPQQKPGEKNEMFIYERPWTDSDLEVVLPKFMNGAELFLKSVYLHDGKYWGVMQYGHRYSWPGWIPMDHLLVVYTTADFEEENKDVFYEYTGKFDYVFSADRVVFWQWPGSDREKRVMADERYTLTDVSVLRAYRDSENREWGFANLKYKNDKNSTLKSEGWICITEPSNNNIPAFNRSAKPAKWSIEGKFKWIKQENEESTVEEYYLDNIEKIRTYEPGKTYTDIDKNAWYGNVFGEAYEYGFFNAWNNKISADQHLDLSEVLILSSQAHSKYKYGKDEGDRLLTLYDLPYGGRRWLGGTIQYCEVEGIIKATEHYNYYEPVTRAEAVNICARILKPKDMEKQNIVHKLVDVDKKKPYYSSIVLLYEAGIISGVDSQGTFKPDEIITRAEAATIFMNIVDTNRRYKGRVYN